MAYVNVAEWTSQHVGDWLYGLDDSILPYVQFFVNNQINGCRLLLLSAQDLINLNINKIGHQEIILEAVELLRNLHYNITSETLQTIALRLACKSRALFNQLKKSAEKAAAAVAAAEATTATTNFNHPISDSDNHHYVSQKKDKNKDKDKDKDHHHHQQQQQQQSKQQQSVESTIDLSPVSTTTLASVSDILSAVKDFISWIDRYPFDGQDKYIQARKSILQLSIELTSTAQRDQQFVQGPNEVIRQCCKKLADLCDRLVQELNDSLAIQAASLEVVTVTKNMDEDLGMHIHSSYSGIHVVGGLKYHSPAYLNGNIEEGDEIIQVNYQTVVGWQLKKLVASMRRFPTKLILTVKKRPRHHSSGSFTVVPQFALPLPEMSIIGNSSLPLGETLSGISNANIYNTTIMMSTGGGGGGQQYPPPSSSTTTTNQSINNNNNNNTQSQQQQFQSMHNNDNNNNNNSYDIISSTTTTTTNLLNNNQDETIKIDHNNQPQNRKPLSSIMISMSKMLNNNDNHENNNIDNFNERNHLDHHRNNHHHNQSTKIIENNNNKSFKNRNRLIQQQQQQQRSKCQSSDDDDDDDSSPLSDLSDDDDDSSTMFSTDSDTDSDCSNNRRHHHHHNHHQHQQHRHSHHRHSHHHHHHQMNGKQQTNKKAKSNPITNVINLQTSSSSSTTTKMVMAKPTATITTITPSTVVEMRTKHDYCSSDHDEFGNCEIECEEDIEEYNDNDSAFYSGRRTTTSTSTSTTSSKNDDTNKLNTTTAATAKSSSTGEKIKNLTNSFVKIRISKQKSSSLSSKENESIDSGDSGIRERDDNDVVNVNIVNDERTDVKPRTSAEFEQLYLMQQNPASTTTAATSATLPNVMINMNKTTNKQQQSSTTKTLNTTKSFDNDHSMMMNRTQSLTSIQLSTITHLTSLAKNIRFANMAQVQQNNNVSLANNTHSKSKFDPVLASKIEKTIHKLSNGDLSMGNYHGYLFTYQGSERIGGNSLDIPTLGIITEQKQLKKWTKIRSVLKDNCLYSYLNDCTNIACFEIPIHLPGYYILVDKQMFLDQYDTNVNVNDNDTVNNDDNEDDTKTLKQLVIFKLVTYHRLFMFAVDSLNELVRWIVRFGYRFCCNPSEQQLCFTYYLSPVHIGQLPSSTTTTVTNSNSNRSLSSKCSTLDSKEFESDDYHDLLTIKSNDSDDGSTQQNHHVKFQNVNCTSTNNDDNNKDAHRFIKSPHPRGSIRFAVRRSGQDMDFIDSTIDVKKTLSETFCSNTETLINDPPPPPPPNLPPRPASSSTTQTITVPTTTQTTTTAITTTTTTVTSDQIPRPKPRISKMAIMNGTSSTTTTTTVNNKVPTTLSSSCVPSQSTTSNMITSAAQRLAPIPVPEKSTHISQTIQHFANLQRQNNLRRSFAQQQQQQQQQITTKNQQQQQQMNYADYDYIINNRPKQSTNDNQLKTTTTSNMNNPHCNMQTTIGNPLYCHVVPMLSNIADNSVHHQSTISSSSSSSTTTSSSSSSSSDHDVLRSSLPPSIDPPPAPPLQSSLSLQTNENIAPIVPPKPNRNEFNKKEKEKEKDQIETPPPPPPILLPRRPINTGQQPPPIPTTSHPQLLRSNSNQQQRQPPPIPPPVCPKPDLIKCLAAAAASSSTTKSNGGKFLNRSFSDATTKTSNSVSKTSNKNQRNNNQQRRPSLKSRHSLEESTQNVGQIENSSTTTCDDYDETGIFFDNNNNNNNNQQQQSFHRTESIGSFDDQQPQTPTTSITTNFDISPTSLISNNNRPTMGISMLAKKRLSNVSADSLAIEKALNLHHSNTTNTNTNSTSITSG